LAGIVYVVQFELVFQVFAGAGTWSIDSLYSDFLRLLRRISELVLVVGCDVLGSIISIPTTSSGLYQPAIAHLRLDLSTLWRMNF